jgi:hypothetical protein
MRVMSTHSTPLPADETSFDLIIIGASLGGTVAAWRAASLGCRTLLIAAHAWLGGQLSAQAVPPDEHPLIEHGGATASYQAFREAIRAHYRNDPLFRDMATMTPGTNPGDGWVSRLCFEPRLAHAYFEVLLAPFVAIGTLHILKPATLLSAERIGRRIHSMQIRSGSGDRIYKAPMFLDATDTGELIAKTQLRYRIGKEARHEFDEPDAPEVADPLDQQPITAVFGLRQHAQPTADRTCSRPPSYDAWCQHVLPHYGYRLFGPDIPGRGRGNAVRLPWVGEGSTLDLWRYRRVIATRQWRDARADVTLVNWAQNDYNQQPLLDGPQTSQAVEAAARDQALAFYFWLREAAPRHDGCGFGYPEWALAPDVMGTTDGFAQQVYVRESRRIVAWHTVHQRDILLPQEANPFPLTPLHYDDSVGTVWYNLDIHPTCVSGDAVNARVRPFTLPLRAFIPRDCDNLLPACKNLGVTHLVNACTRVHPAEWLIGEVAAALAHELLTHSQTGAELLASSPDIRAFQAKLSQLGVPLKWEAEWLEKLDPRAWH